MYTFLWILVYYYDSFNSYKIHTQTPTITQNDGHLENKDDRWKNIQNKYSETCKDIQRDVHYFLKNHKSVCECVCAYAHHALEVCVSLYLSRDLTSHFLKPFIVKKSTCKWTQNTNEVSVFCACVHLLGIRTGGCVRQTGSDEGTWYSSSSLSVWLRLVKGLVCL